jgi:protein involved in polysaccharide export with SLBB domain
MAPNVRELKPGDPVPPARTTFDPAFEYEPQYLIRVGDEIRIEFLSDAEPANSASRVTVRPDGRISMRGVDDVLAAGRTPAQLDSVLTAGFAKILVDPSLSVIVDHFSAEKVFVIGSVRSPREIQLEGPLSLMQGIAAAGGFVEGANRKEVVIIRRQDQGQLAAFRIDTDRILNHPAESRELALRGQDIVYVPRSPVGQVGDFVTLYFHDVVNPLLLTLLSIDELHARHFLFE